MNKVRTVLKQLKSAGLEINAEKSFFGKTS